MSGDPEAQERLKSALWYSIGQIIDDESAKSNTNTTSHFIGALTELTWAQIESVAKDLESFAKHAGRSQITTDDVMLLARRNEGLEAVLRSYVEDLRQKSGAPAQKGRRK